MSADWQANWDYNRRVVAHVAELNAELAAWRGVADNLAQALRDGIKAVSNPVAEDIADWAISSCAALAAYDRATAPFSES